jgi:hypothetical protein
MRADMHRYPSPRAYSLALISYCISIAYASESIFISSINTHWKSILQTGKVKVPVMLIPNAPINQSRLTAPQTYLSSGTSPPPAHAHFDGKCTTIYLLLYRCTQSCVLSTYPGVYTRTSTYHTRVYPPGSTPLRTHPHPHPASPLQHQSGSASQPVWAPPRIIETLGIRLPFTDRSAHIISRPPHILTGSAPKRPSRDADMHARPTISPAFLLHPLLTSYMSPRDHGASLAIWACAGLLV